MPSTLPQDHGASFKELMTSINSTQERCNLGTCTWIKYKCTAYKTKQKLSNTPLTWKLNSVAVAYDVFLCHFLTCDSNRKKAIQFKVVEFIWGSHMCWWKFIMSATYFYKTIQVPNTTHTKHCRFSDSGPNYLKLSASGAISPSYNFI